MSFAKKLARKRQKMGEKKIAGETKARNSAARDTRHAFIRQNVTDSYVRLEAIQNVTTMFMAASRETFKFGRQRLERLLDRMKSYFECIRGGYVTMPEICQILRDEAHMDIRDERPKAMDHVKSIQYNVIDEMSAAFLLSIMDVYGYKATLMNRVYRAAADISVKLDKRIMGIKDVEAIVAEVMPLSWRMFEEEATV